MAAPSVCTMTADFLQPDANPLYRFRVEVSVDCEFAAFVVSSNWIGSSCTYYTDSDGHLAMDLVRGVTYKIRFGPRSDVFYTFTCPDSASAGLLGYVFPYIATIDVEETSYSIGVGETASLSALATYSNGDEVSVTSAVTFSSANPAVASVSGSTLTGVAVGATTVVVDTVDDDSLPAKQDMMEEYIVSLPMPTYTIGSARPVTVS